MNKKGNVYAIIIIAILLVAVVGGGFYLFSGKSQKVVQDQESIKEIASITNAGDVASIGVYVRDVSQDNVNTKIAVPTYCVDADRGMVIDGVTSSTSAEITGKTTIGKTLSCYAFNSTTQTAGLPGEETPYFDVLVDEEAEHIVVDAFRIPIAMGVEVYDDSYNKATGGRANVTIGANGEGTFLKMRITNNQSDHWYPFGAIAFDTGSGTNISSISMVGGVVLNGFTTDYPGAKIVDGSIVNHVTSRNEQWDYLFEIDGDSGKEGNQVVIIEENDYIETGGVTFKSTVGCDAQSSDTSGAGDGGRSQIRLIGKGYYRSTQSGEPIKYGHETDASSASTVMADTGQQRLYCD